MDPITVALEQKGADDVASALRDVQDSIAALDAFSAKSGRASSRERVRAVREEASERRKASKADAPAARVRESKARASAGFDRALGGNGGRASVARASSGPNMGEFTGLASSSAGSLMGTIGKFGAIGGAIALFKSGLDLASSALETFGGFLISDVIKPAFALETAATQLENASGGQIKAAQIQEQTRAAALKHNMDPMALFEAAGAMIDLTGDAKTAFGVLDTVGTLAKGRGADPAQLAEFAASLKNFDPNASAEQISNLLLTQLAQGDMGSVPLKEAAKLGGRLTAPAAFLAGNTDVRMASMGALVQSGRKGFGSTDELVTGIGNLINEVTSQKMVGSKKYLNSEGQIGDVASLIGGILKDTGGDAKKIGALGLSDPAAKLVKAYLPAFSDAGKGDKGKEAVESLIRGFMEARTSLETEKNNERKVLQTSGEKWAATIEGLKDKLLDVMPEVQKFVDQFAQIAPQFGSALVTLAKIMIKVANYLAGIFGEEAVDENTATGETRGEYKINPETGQFEFVKQSVLNAQKKNDIFSPDYAGPGLKLAGFAGEKTPDTMNADGTASDPSRVSGVQFPPGAPFAPLNFTLPGLSSAAPPTSQSSGSSSPSADAALASLDALAPKAAKLGLMFDKLAASGNDANRTTPLSQR